jgi:cyclopropane-fatty-acyl-phospholipid synthase
VVGVTISAEQQKMAQQRCEGLDVTILLQDYRDLHDHFDRIVSVGMFEHVGPKNYATYFDVVDRNLKPDGRFLLHTIGSKKPTIALTRGSINISSPTAACRRFAILPSQRIPFCDGRLAQFRCRLRHHADGLV